MSLTIQGLSYSHSNKETLFQDISLFIHKGEKVSLIGRNGTGKSTLLKLIIKQLEADTGQIIYSDHPYLVPQHYGQYDELTVSEVLKVDKKLQAIQNILAGNIEEENFSNLEDDWEIEDKIGNAFNSWNIEHISMNGKFSDLSGGEKTKVFLAGISIYNPEIILMDEPTNHLDAKGREDLYDFIRKTSSSLLIVSHDRVLLNLLEYTYELTPKGLIAYGGNYDFYHSEKNKLITSLKSQLEEKRKEQQTAKREAIKLIERQQKQSVRGEKRKVKERTPRIMLKNYKDKAENTTNKLKNQQGDKQATISESIQEIRKSIPDISKMKLDFGSSDLHKNKILIKGENINYAYESQSYLWANPLNFIIQSGQRIAIEGNNGAGKTTLLKLLTGDIEAQKGEIVRSETLKFIFIDQDYSLIKNNLTIVEQIDLFNKNAMPDHEVKTILNRFLFTKHTWDKECIQLSGGEKMRLTLCCLMISNSNPDLFILDEPTNNLDIENMEILTNTLKDFKGTLLVISHDQRFKEEIGINQTWNLTKK